VKRNRNAESIFQMRAIPNAAGVDVASMIDWNVGDGACGLHQMDHTGEHVARRKSVTQQRQIVSADFGAVTQEAGRILDCDNIIRGQAKCCLLDGGPGQADERFTGSLDLDGAGMAMCVVAVFGLCSFR
jgi:hypothetical protein